MCTKMRWVRNPYSHTDILAPCGKCPSCLQEKANKRYSRLLNNVRKDCTSFFCTFTYNNDCVPYVYKYDLMQLVERSKIFKDCFISFDMLDSPDLGNQLMDFDKEPTFTLKVHRDYDVRYVRKPIPSDSYHVEPKYYRVDSVEEFEIPLSQIDDSMLFAPELTHKEGCVGISLYSDIQNYYKRLRQNLKRRYGIYPEFSFYSCAEYGETYFRPHFHALVQVPQEHAYIFRLSLAESWSFDDSLPRKVEIARKPESYVSSYVNCDTDLPTFLSKGIFRQKHSYSQGFGMALQAFSLVEINKAVDRRNLTYDIKRNRGSELVTTSVPVPKYVINRHYPKFMGYCRLNDNQVFELLSSSKGYSKYAFLCGANKEQSRKMQVMLNNAFVRYRLVYPDCSRFDFAYHYQRAWKQYQSELFKLFYENPDCIPWFEMYDNIDSVVIGKRKSPTLSRIIVDNPVDNYNPNCFSFRVGRTLYLDDLYYKKKKKRKVTNAVHHNYGYNT